MQGFFNVQNETIYKYYFFFNVYDVYVYDVHRRSEVCIEVNYFIPNQHKALHLQGFFYIYYLKQNKKQNR